MATITEVAAHQVSVNSVLMGTNLHSKLVVFCKNFCQSIFFLYDVSPPTYCNPLKLQIRVIRI